MAKKAALYLAVSTGEAARHLPPYATRWVCERSVKYNGYNNTLSSGTNP
jgi:hypothetical protein